MGQLNTSTHDWIAKELRLLRRTSDILFNRAPCMMHMLNQGGRIANVNQQWLDTLGYKRDDVVGRSSVEFLTKSGNTRWNRNRMPLRIGGVQRYQCLWPVLPQDLQPGQLHVPVGRQDKGLQLRDRDHVGGGEVAGRRPQECKSIFPRWNPVLS